jgi:hypothetical protein
LNRAATRLTQLTSIPQVAAPWLAGALTLAGGVLFLVQSWIYAHTQASLLDEGAYLLKGYLFASGQYWPYQDYGPWTNHMPLAFLIPGYVQELFGPGLRTGRYLAIVLSLLILIGIWIVVQRLGGKWWAALAVWALALNPAVIKLYSLANSQSLLACMFVWTMVLVLGEARPTWQLLGGSVLAGLMMMTRVNLAPVLFLVIAYILWAYGWRAALLAALAGFLPLLVGHALYWPAILRIWAHWVPADVLPFLRPFAHPAGSDPTWNPLVTPDSRVTSFFHGFRFHFVALVGALSALLLWPGRKNWKSPWHFRMAVFLSVLLVMMFLFHMWAALGKDYCVFCFPVYLSFFTFLGLILLVVSFHAWAQDLPFWRQALVSLVIVGMAAGLGYSAFAEVGDKLLPVLDLQVPRMGSNRILPGTVPLGALLQNRYGMEALALEQLARRVLPGLAGLLTGLLLLLGAGLAVMGFRSKGSNAKTSSASLALVSFLGLGFLLSPTIVLGGGYNTYDCSGDVIAGYEAAGEHLAGLIPAGSRVYWRGGNSAVPLLYLEGVEIYPAQINGDYSLRKGGDPDALARYGFWSEELARQWASEADFILIEERLFGGWLGELVEAGGHNELRETPNTVPCRGNSSIHIYKKRR